MQEVTKGQMANDLDDTTFRLLVDLLSEFAIYARKSIHDVHVWS